MSSNNAGNVAPSALDLLPHYELKDDSFMRRHFGTDMLVGSWLFLSGSILYMVAALMIFCEYEREDALSEYIVFDSVVQISSAVFFVVGSAYFVVLTYPEEMEKSFKALFGADTSKMTFWEKNFTANDFLFSLWLFWFACVGYLIDSINMMIDDPSSWVGYVYFVATFMFLSVFLIWIVAFNPENLMANNGTGSEHVWDFFNSYNVLQYGCCCCCAWSDDFREWMELHLKKDVVIPAWVFTVVLGGIALNATYSLIFYYYSPLAWIFFVMGWCFFFGLYFFAYCSYPENMHACNCYNFFSGEVDEKKEATVEERESLVSTAIA